MDVPIFGRATPIEVCLGTIARVSEEELSQMISDVIDRQKDEAQYENQVKVLFGVFEGVRGKFLYADPDADKWTVEIELFGAETKVTFQRDELQMFI